MTRGSRGPPRRPGQSGRLVVLAILGLGAVLAAVKTGQELQTGRRLRAKAAALRQEMSALDRESLLAGGHRRLRDLLSAGGYGAELRRHRDRSALFLREEFRKDPPAAAERDAWVLLLLEIDSPLSRELLRQILPEVSAPDLRREIEDSLARGSSTR